MLLIVIIMRANEYIIDNGHIFTKKLKLHKFVTILRQNDHKKISYHVENVVECRKFSH